MGAVFKVANRAEFQEKGKRTIEGAHAHCNIRESGLNRVYEIIRKLVDTK